MTLQDELDAESAVLHYVVVDIETVPQVGIGPAQDIREIGACRVEVLPDGRHSVAARPFHRLIRSEVVSPVTGSRYSPSPSAAAADAESDTGLVACRDALGDLVDFCAGTPVVAHNGRLHDFAVLEDACRRHDVPTLHDDRLDSLDLAHVAAPRIGSELRPNADGSIPPASRSLDDLAAWLGVADRRRERHRAVPDAELTVLLIERMLKMISSTEPVRQLQRRILHAGCHPWARFLEHPLVDVSLIDCLRLDTAQLSAQDGSPNDDVPGLGHRSVERSSTAAQPVAQLDEASVLAPLSPGGALVTGEGRVFRDQQRKMAAAVLAALADSSRGSGDGGVAPTGRLAVEAPTGTGKTLAYLVPAAACARARRRPVAIATHSKVLQDQLLTDIEIYRRTVGDIRWVLLKGIANYVSVGYLDAAIEAGSEEPVESLVLAVLAGWAAQTATGDWDDLSIAQIEAAWPQVRELRARLSVDELRDFATDEADRLCFYRRALNSISSTDIVVANHAVLVTLDRLFEEVSHLIIDEGHNLEDAATSALTEETGASALSALFDCVAHARGGGGVLRRYAVACGDNPPGGQIDAALESLDRCREAIAELDTRVVDYVRGRTEVTVAQAASFGVSYRLRPGFDTRRAEFAPARRAAQALCEHLRHLSGCLALGPPASAQGTRHWRHIESELGRISRDARAAADVVAETMSARDDENWISIVDLFCRTSAGGDGTTWEWQLRRVPLSVADRLKAKWMELASVVLTSATLRVNGEFGHVLERVGLSDALRLCLPTPFEDLSTNELVVLPRHLPVPRGGLMPEFTKAEADELARLILVARGRTLALFTATARMAHARDFLWRVPELRTDGLGVMCQGDAPSGELVDRMRADNSSSLLATRSFWEGISVPGEALSLLVIEKLPFAPLGDPVVAARMHEIERRGEDAFTRYLVPEAALRFTQAVGRLIRTETDRGVCVVLDKRIRGSAPYASVFLDSLPGPPSIQRPSTEREAYAAVAQHLGLPLSATVQHRLEGLPSSDPWRELEGLTDKHEEAAGTGRVDELLERARNLLGFDEWRPGQLDVMRSFARGDDTLAVMPTGAGKSLTYQLPAMLRRGLTLVVSPLVALMRDQVEGLRERGLTRVAELRSGQTQSEQAEVLRRARNGAYKLLYVSPERLWSSRLRQALADVEVSAVAIDEAHCISQWGHSFRPEYRTIAQAVGELSSGVRPPILAVTATGTREVTGDIVASLRMRAAPVTVELDPNRAELCYYVEDCDSFDERDVAVMRIAEAFRHRAMIVYVPSRATAARLSELLRLDGHTARPYHGGMTSAQRVHTEEAFRSGEIDVVVGTNAFGLGIDKPDVEVVVHFEMPASIEGYVQEVGRAARGAADGSGSGVGHCILLRTPGDCGVHESFIRDATPSLDAVMQHWQSLVIASERMDAPVALEGLAGTRSAAKDRDREHLELAAHLLAEQGCVERIEDMIEEGIVRVLPGAARHPSAEGGEGPLSADACEVLESLSGIDERAFGIRLWASELGWTSPRRLERALVELSYAEAVDLSAWQVSSMWRRVPGKTPDFAAIDEALEQRRSAVRKLSDSAKRYRDSNRICRRRILLDYLGVNPAPSCAACDVCRCDLERPWEQVAISREHLDEALNAESVIFEIAAEVPPGDRNRRPPSRVNIERCLAGESGDGTRSELSLPLRTHRLYGRLAALGQRGVRREVDRLLREGKLRVERVESQGTSWETLRLMA
ncbi:RecQ family ATP-dependent DNA helicase [Candidatus Poriferisodalis sp.]|uniref:RecQ family ATP-dependent DNA helicase n=1 Tax=Candidatus Poriferisodalis sp. TaxID=3101277 RepID=UPI003B0299BD